MLEINHLKYYFQLRNNRLAYVLDVIAQDLRVFEANFLENTEDKIISNQRVIHKVCSLKSLGIFIISFSSTALGFTSHALC
jgi:hypothetical protein